MAKKVKQVSTNRPKRPATKSAGPKRATSRRPDFIATSAQASKQARDKFEFDLQRRQRDSDRVLTADDLSGLYDPKRQLFTTVDGTPRPLTFDDLQNFRAAVRDMKARAKSKKFLGGIKPKQVLDLSWADDRARAHKEITAAIPVSHRGGVIHFQTNSGPNSRVSRHHVYVQLLNYDAAVASPVEPEKIVKEMFSGNVRFDCDCERHTFWFRYMASIGGYAYGRQETGFPRIRNPRLRGLACKHVLRVMSLLEQSPTLKQGLGVRMIKQGRDQLTARRQVVKVRDMEKLAEQLKRDSWRQRAVRSSEEKRAARGGVSVAQQRAREREKAARKERQALERNKKAALRGLESNAKQLLSLGVINQEQYDQMLQAARSG